MTDPIRIFIGTSSNNEDVEAEMVLEYSLRTNTDRELDITWMRQTHDEESPWGGWQTERWSTPFSGFRWAIPEVCGFEGKAIYMDVDQVNIRDIGELFDTDLNGRACGARRGARFGGHEFCVMLIDCERMCRELVSIERMKINEDIHHRYIGKFSGSAELVFDLDPRWNNHDGEGLGLDNIWHLHYTKMSTQPWKPKWFTGTTEEHPREDLVKFWFNMREMALGAGYKLKLNDDTFGDYNIIGR